MKMVNEKETQKITIKQRKTENWRKPNLNAQQNHLALTLSL